MFQLKTEKFFLQIGNRPGTWRDLPAMVRSNGVKLIEKVALSQSEILGL
jgi:hypothetical protein